MPKCINDEDRYYKGNEPSPKGLGYCAHAESTGFSKLGQDGSMWIVITDKNNKKKWKLKTPKIRLKRKRLTPAMVASDKLVLNKEEVLIKKNKWDIRKRAKTFVFQSNVYYIIDNGGHSFKVTIEDIYAYICKRQTDHPDFDYDMLVAKYEPTTIFPGDHLYEVDRKNGITHVGMLHGNSILLHLRGHQYVYIGSVIYEFTTDEPITNYYSHMSGTVAYPIAISDNFVYLMLECVVMPRSLFNDMGEKHHIGEYPYLVYYFEMTKKERKQYTRPIKVKIIHTRI
jgi:hypothetical protein